MWLINRFGTTGRNSGLAVCDATVQQAGFSALTTIGLQFKFLLLIIIPYEEPLVIYGCHGKSISYSVAAIVDYRSISFYRDCVQQLRKRWNHGSNLGLLVTMTTKCKMKWLILLADYCTFRIYVIFLIIKCIFVTQILTWSDAVDFLAYALGMQYSVVTADQGCSTKMVKNSIASATVWQHFLQCKTCHKHINAVLPGQHFWDVY